MIKLERLFPLALLSLALTTHLAHADSAMRVVRPAQAAAQITPPEKTDEGSTVLIVDTQRILQESFAAQDVHKQLDQARDKFQAELAKDEDRLRVSEQKLTQDRDSADAESHAKAQMDLRTDVESVDRKAQARRRALDIAFAESMQSIRTSLVKIVEQMASDHHASLVLLRQQVLWNDASLDITEPVLAQLNKKLPKLAVKISDNPDMPEQNVQDLPVMKFDNGE